MFHRTLRLALVAITSVAGCLAQTTAAPARDATALAAVSAAIVASGPAANIADTTVVVRQGTTETTVTSLGPDRIRADSHSAAANHAWIVKAGRRLRLAADGATWRAAPDANAPFTRRTLIPGLLLADELARPDASLAWIGDEAVGGTAATHVRFTRALSSRGDPALTQALAHAAQLDVWIADDTHLVLKLGWWQLASGDIRRGTPAAITYSDYRATPGPAGILQLPYMVTSWVADTQVATASVESFQFNTGVAPALFTPGGGK